MNIINFGFYIGIPFWPFQWKSLWYTYFNLSKNKTLELQFMRDGTLIGFAANWSIRDDHAGLHLEFNLLGFEFSIDIRDNRHWDRDKNTWEVYDHD